MVSDEDDTSLSRNAQKLLEESGKSKTIKDNIYKKLNKLAEEIEQLTNEYNKLHKENKTEEAEIQYAKMQEKMRAMQGLYKLSREPSCEENKLDEEQSYMKYKLEAEAKRLENGADIMLFCCQDELAKELLEKAHNIRKEVEKLEAGEPIHPDVRKWLEEEKETQNGALPALK